VHLTHGEIHLERGPVLASANDFTPAADELRFPTVEFRHQEVQALANHILSTVAKHLRRGGIIGLYDTVLIHRDDAVKRTVLARWPVTSAQNNFPMALDEGHHRLFVGCWMPPQLLVFDTENGKEVASGEIAGSTDDLFYDARRGRVYVLTSQGFLEVFQQKDPDHYERIARYPTPPRTQTGLFVPEWGKLFAAVQKQDEQSAEIRVYQAH